MFELNNECSTHFSAPCEKSQTFFKARIDLKKGLIEYTLSHDGVDLSNRPL